MRASALGLILGLVLCAGALRAMRSVLYGVGVYDAPTILLVVFDSRLCNAHCWDRAYAANCTNRPCTDAARRVRQRSGLYLNRKPSAGDSPLPW